MNKTYECKITIAVRSRKEKRSTCHKRESKSHKDGDGRGVEGKLSQNE